MPAPSILARGAAELGQSLPAAGRAAVSPESPAHEPTAQALSEPGTARLGPVGERGWGLVGERGAGHVSHVWELGRRTV